MPGSFRQPKTTQELIKDINMAVNLVKALEKENDELKAKSNTDIEQALQIIGLHEKQNKNLKEKLLKLEDELATFVAQSEDDKKAIELLQEQVDQAMTSSNSLEESYKKQIEELENAKQVVERERDSLKTERDALKDELQVIKTVISKNTGITTSSALISVNRLIEKVERSKSEDEFKRLEQEINLVKAAAFSDKNLKAQYDEANSSRFRSIARQAELTKDLNKANVTIQKQKDKIEELEKADKAGKTAKRHEDYLTEENKKYKGKLETSSKMLTQTKAELRREQKAADELNSALIGEMTARTKAEQERDTAQKGWVKNKKVFKICMGVAGLLLISGVAALVVSGNKLTASEKQEMIEAQGTAIAEADGYYLAGNTTVDNAETHKKSYKEATDEGVEALSVTAEDSYTTYYNAILEAKVSADKIRYSLEESYDNYKSAVEASNKSDIEAYATEISEYKADLLEYSENVQTNYNNMIDVSGHSADEWEAMADEIVRLKQESEDKDDIIDEKDEIIQETQDKLNSYEVVNVEYEKLNNESKAIYQDIKTALADKKGSVQNITMEYQASTGTVTLTYDKFNEKGELVSSEEMKSIKIETGIGSHNEIISQVAESLGIQVDANIESEME